MRDLLARYPNQPGAGVLRQALSDPDLDKNINSGVERRFLRLCRHYGIPEPKVNLWIALPELFAAGGVEVDFCWPESRLVVETDGASDHSTFRAAVNDPARDRALRLAGWTVFRYPASDLRRFGEAAVREISAMLARQRAPT